MRRTERGGGGLPMSAARLERRGGGGTQFRGQNPLGRSVPLSCDIICVSVSLSDSEKNNSTTNLSRGRKTLTHSVSQSVSQSIGGEMENKAITRSLARSSVLPPSFPHSALGNCDANDDAAHVVFSDRRRRRGPRAYSSEKCFEINRIVCRPRPSCEMKERRSGVNCCDPSSPSPSPPSPFVCCLLCSALR